MSAVETSGAKPTSAGTAAFSSAPVRNASIPPSGSATPKRNRFRICGSTFASKNFAPPKLTAPPSCLTAAKTAPSSDLGCTDLSVCGSGWHSGVLVNGSPSSPSTLRPPTFSGTAAMRVSLQPPSACRQDGSHNRPSDASLVKPLPAPALGVPTPANFRCSSEPYNWNDPKYFPHRRNWAEGDTCGPPQVAHESG
jgi:hypothetical protein